MHILCTFLFHDMKIKYVIFPVMHKRKKSCLLFQSLTVLKVGFFLTLIFICFIISACAEKPVDSTEQQSQESIVDPFIGKYHSKIINKSITPLLS